MINNICENTTDGKHIFRSWDVNADEWAYTTQSSVGHQIVAKCVACLKFQGEKAGKK